MPRTAQSSFGTLRDNLVDTKVGDDVYVSADIGLAPTHYLVTDVPAPGTYYLKGDRGAKRTLIVATAERAVWLTKGTRNWKVVQAFRERGMDAAFTQLEKAEARVADGRIATLETEVERLRAALYDTNAQLVESQRSKHELDKAHAALGRELEAVEVQRDALSTALCQIRNAAHGVAPGTKPLPSNSPPANVAIDVIAALLRATEGSRSRSPILVSPDVMYRGAIEKALPDRMHGEPTNGDPR